MKNMNDVAIAVTKLEGKEQSISIAQVKEVLRIVGELVADDASVFMVLSRHWSIKHGRKRKKFKIRKPRK